MSDMLAKKKQETRQKIAARRAKVLDTTSRVFWRRDQEWLRRRMNLQQQATFKTLFEKRGYNDPNVGIGIDFIAWNIDYGLWDGLRHSPEDYEALQPIFEEAPRPTDTPWCAQFRDYQRSRLGQKAEKDPLNQANTETKSLKRRSDAEDNKANDLHPQPKKLRQQELKFTTIEPQTSNYPGPYPHRHHRHQQTPPAHVLSQSHAFIYQGFNPRTTRKQIAGAAKHSEGRCTAGHRRRRADGDFFTVRLREAVAATRINQRPGAHPMPCWTGPFGWRCARREEPVTVGVDGEGAGAGVKEGPVTVWLLAVAVADRAEVTSLRGLGHLAETDPVLGT
ncbi:predicted protein [Chaetomium globosum CBS 148.51]|uniref:Uncharacterized protein n=1 Tax=Chaetomium globosum (strain ATCC 6205 / CBS 148.51 / DSM 1962 / NBRC 6347 / NRRL 1970) TaxID=306901 RepID=Q2HCS1_CHAGB|nr:uncharacterized protein CHGG_01983 [Chaetomium globosum CBS 148.51]EAQ93748.1 predicted protein [Chaetomium globosum CBS 148.51]